MQIDVAIDNLTSVRSGWAAVIDGPSPAVGDSDAALRLRVKDVRIETRSRSPKHGWTCWGHVAGSATGVVVPSPGAECGLKRIAAPAPPAPPPPAAAAAVVVDQHHCNVKDFGATGDGVALDTVAINTAIHTARCSSITLPSPGRYLSGTIRLKSHMILVVETGATVLGAPDGNYEPASVHSYTYPPPPVHNVCGRAWEHGNRCSN